MNTTTDKSETIRNKFIKDAARLFRSKRLKKPHMGIFEAADLQGLTIKVCGLSRTEMGCRWDRLMDDCNTRLSGIVVTGLEKPIYFFWEDIYRIDHIKTKKELDALVDKL